MWAYTREMLLQYQRGHREPWNQVLHYCAFLCAFLAWVWLIIDWRVTVALAVVHYALAWTGHFYFERNKPASFKRPWLGFYAGFAWFFIRTAELLSGRRLLPPVEPRSSP